MSLWPSFIIGQDNFFLRGALIFCVSVAALYTYVVKSVKWTPAVHATLKELRLYWIVVMWYAKTFPRGKNFGALTLKTPNLLKTVFEVIDHFQPTPFKVYNRFYHLMYIDKPEDLQILLNHSNALEKADIYKFFGALGGDSLLTVAVSEWKSRRRLMRPFFSTDKLETYSRPMYEKGQLKLRKLQTWADTEKVVDLRDFMSRLNVETVTETLMGLDPETSFTESEKGFFKQDIKGASERIMHRIIHVWLHLDSLYAGVKRFNGWSQIEKRLHQFWKKVIQCRREILMETSGKGTRQEDAVLLDTLLTRLHTRQNSDGDDKNTSLIQEVGIMYAAGSESSAMSECLTLLMLAMNPRIQEEVCQEIIEVLGTEDEEKPITIEDVENMSLLDRCVKENLRLFPTVPLYGRRVTTTITLSNGEVAEKDMNVFVSAYHLHRKPELYDNPSTFDPDNFLPERVQKRHPYSYLPFSAGPRGCIGGRYAMVSIKILLATIIRKYRLTTDMKMGDLKYNMDVGLRSSHGCKVKIYNRR